MRVNDLSDDARKVLDKQNYGPEASLVLDLIDFDELVDELEGRNGFRKSKPKRNESTAKVGLLQYVWRHARLHGGMDTSIPTTASWWLKNWLDEKDIDGSVSGVLDETGKEITEVLDAVVVEVLLEFGINPANGARRWDGLIA